MKSVSLIWEISIGQKKTVDTDEKMATFHMNITIELAKDSNPCLDNLGVVAGENNESVHRLSGVIVNQSTAIEISSRPCENAIEENG